MGKATAKKTKKRNLSWLGKLFRRVIFLCLLFLVLVWAAPKFVAYSPLRHQVANDIFCDLNGIITDGEASLGWFSPVLLKNVEIRDPQRELLLQAPEVQSSFTLLKILSDQSNLGPFRFDNPVLHVLGTKATTNLEQAIAKYLYPEDDTPGPWYGIDVQVINGQVDFTDRQTKQKWTLAPLNFTVNIPTDASPIEVKIKGQFKGLDAKVATDLTFEGVGNGYGISPFKIGGSLLVDAFPLKMAEPFVRRMDAAAKVQGKLYARMKGSWNSSNTKSKAYLNGNVRVNNLVASASSLGTDQLRISKLEIPHQITSVGSSLHIEKAQVLTDVGTASVKGQVDTGKTFLAVLQQPDVDVKAEVDLAKLAMRLPQTLRLREDTKLTSGKVKVHLHSHSSERGVLWQGDINTSEVKGIAQGRQFSWSEPLMVSLKARQNKQDLPVIEQLLCKSSFLNAHANGTADRWTITANYDLARLSQELSQFADLGPVRLSGNGLTNLTVEQPMEGEFKVNGTSTFNNLQLAGFGKLSWFEQELVLTLSSSGKKIGADNYLINSGLVHLQAGQDQLEAKLLSPMMLPAKNGDLSAKFSLIARGDLSRWQRRIPSLPQGKDLQLYGSGDLAAVLDYQPEELQFSAAKLKVKNLYSKGFGLTLKEPSVELAANGKMDLTTGKTSLGKSYFYSKGFRYYLNSGKVDLSNPKAPVIAAQGKTQGYLEGLQSWFPALAGTPAIKGWYSGNLSLTSDQNQIEVKTDLNLINVVVGPTRNPYWRGTNLKLTADGRLMPSADVLVLRQLDLSGTPVAINSTGQIARLSKGQDLSLQGKIYYDMKNLEPFLQKHLSTSIQLEGKNSQPFQIVGTLSNPNPKYDPLSALRGETSVRWSKLHAYGFQSSASQMKVTLASGWLRGFPIKAKVNGGNLHIIPLMKIAPGPQELYLSKSKAVDRANISKEMASGAIKYALPVLEGWTEGKGQISLELDSARIPLADPTKADIAGRFIIHHAQLSATPLVKEFSALLNRTASVQVRKNSVVPFRMVNGMVYHDKLVLEFPELTITTRGWVGLDGRVNMAAEFPIPPRWLGGGRVNQVLAKQKITVPIGGTLQRPRLDQRQLQAAGRRFIQNSAQELIQQEIQGGLKKLLGDR